MKLETVSHLSRDGNIRYYEFENDEFWPLAEYKSSDPQRGVAFIPKRALSVEISEALPY
jgi:coronin-1B/1C/6